MGGYLLERKGGVSITLGLKNLSVNHTIKESIPGSLRHSNQAAFLHVIGSFSPNWSSSSTEYLEALI